MRSLRLLSLLLLFGVLGCASDDTLRVGSTHDPLERFPAAATWLWDDAANRLPEDERLEPLDLDGVIREIDKDVDVESAGQDIAAKLDALGFPRK